MSTNKLKWWRKSAPMIGRWTSTVCGYRGVSYSLKTEVLVMRAVCMRRGNDVDICTRVNEETSTRGLVRDEE